MKDIPVREDSGGHGGLRADEAPHRAELSGLCGQHGVRGRSRQCQALGPGNHGEVRARRGALRPTHECSPGGGAESRVIDLI